MTVSPGRGSAGTWTTRSTLTEPTTTTRLTRSDRCAVGGLDPERARRGQERGVHADPEQGRAQDCVERPAAEALGFAVAVLAGHPLDQQEPEAVDPGPGGDQAAIPVCRVYPPEGDQLVERLERQRARVGLRPPAVPAHRHDAPVRRVADGEVQ